MQVSLRVPVEELEKRERQETNAQFAKRLFPPSCLNGWRRFGRPTPTNACEFFFKTNRGLVNKARQQTFGPSEARGPAWCFKPSTNIFGHSAWFVPRRARPKGC